MLFQAEGDLDLDFLLSPVALDMLKKDHRTIQKA